MKLIVYYLFIKWIYWSIKLLIHDWLVRQIVCKHLARSSEASSYLSPSPIPPYLPPLTNLIQSASHLGAKSENTREAYKWIFQLRKQRYWLKPELVEMFWAKTFKHSNNSVLCKHWNANWCKMSSKWRIAFIPKLFISRVFAKNDLWAKRFVWG